MDRDGANASMRTGSSVAASTVLLDTMNDVIARRRAEAEELEK